MIRNRPKYFLLIVVAILLGLFTRTEYVPVELYSFLGDYLYALMFFFIVGFVFSKMQTLYVGLIALMICCLIEFSQLYQVDWMNTLRSNKIGGLILGNDFLWGDMIRYFLGVTTGSVLEVFYYKKRIGLF